MIVTGISSTRRFLSRCVFASSLLLAGQSIRNSSEISAAPADEPAETNSVRSHISMHHLAVGVPDEDIGTIENAGLVNVIYGLAGTGLTSQNNRSLDQNVTGIDSSSSIDENFGYALASGDFNGDGLADLAVGVPGEYLLVNGFFWSHCGAVHIFYGSPSGGFSTDSDHLLHESINGASVGCESDDRYGAALAVGDFDNNGFEDLAVGIPMEDVPSGSTELENAGAGQIFYGSPSGLSTANSWVFSQIGSDLEEGDRFGFSFSVGHFNDDAFADLAVGAPYEKIQSTAASEGQVNVLYGSAAGLTRNGEQIWQLPPDTYGLFGISLTAGDFNGDGRDDLAAGAPYHNISQKFWAGAVSIIYGSASGLSALNRQLLHQDYSDNLGAINGIAEDGDFFGNALASGDFNGDGRDDLAVGAPLEALINNTVHSAGTVNVIYGSNQGLSTSNNQIWDLSDPNLPDTPKDQDNFGRRLASGDFNADGFLDLAIGVPGKGFGAIIQSGMVVVMHGSSSGLTAVGSQAWGQDLPPEINGGAENFDRFGGSLAVIESPIDTFEIMLPVVIR